MKFGMQTLDDIDVKSKTVFCRVDINEPVDWETGELRDTTRLRACAPTLRELIDKGARVVILAHQGSDLDYANFFTTAPHAKALTMILGMEVFFVDDTCGPTARTAIASLKDGEVLLLDNLRFLTEESVQFERGEQLTAEKQAKSLLVRKLAPLAECYVCDAFAAAHHNQPSLCAFQQLMPSAMGRLFEEEMGVITRLMEEPERPSVFVFGGAKVGAAFQMIRTVLSRGIADQVLVAGLVGLVLLWADGDEIGAPTRAFITGRGDDLVEEAAALLTEFHSRIVLPADYGFVRNGKRREAMVHALPEDALVTDIGEATAELFSRIIFEAKTVFVNGTMGVFEKSESALGTMQVWDALAQTEAHTIIGGQATIAATHQFGKNESINYISTGDTTLIRFLSGEELPVVRALRGAVPLK